MIRADGWFIYEPGDEVLCLDHLHRGIITEVEQINFAERTQLLTLKTREGVVEHVPGQNIEPLRSALPRLHLNQPKPAVPNLD